MTDELHNAAIDKENGHLMVQFLIEEEHVNVDELHSEWKTRAVDWAAQQGSLKTLRYLIEERKANLEASTKGKNLLFWAAQNPNKDVLKYVADREKRLFSRFNDKTTDLHAAAIVGDLKWVNDLLQDNPDSINQVDINGYNPLYWAAYFGNTEVVERVQKHEVFKSSHATDLQDSINRGFAKKCFRNGMRNRDNNPIIDYDEAVQFYEKIQNKKPEDYSDLINLYADLALFHENNDRLEAAKEAYKDALSFCEQLVAIDKNEHEYLTAVQKHLNNVEQQIASLAQQKLERDALVAESKAWGFEYQKIKEDGNCFFRAIVDQLQHINHPLSKELPQDEESAHLKLREITVDYIRKFASEYQNFILGFDQTVDEYIEVMEESETWVDHIAINAFSRVSGLTIVLIRSDKATPTVCKPPQATATVYLAFEIERHYGSLHQRSDWATPEYTERLLKLIRDQEVMDPFIDEHKPDLDSAKEATPGEKRKGETTLRESLNRFSILANNKKTSKSSEIEGITLDAPPALETQPISKH